MESLAFILVLAGHQPPGTPHPEMQDAFRRAYVPLLEALLRHEDLRLGLHLSGPLLRWLDAHQPGWLDTLAELVGSGRVELVGGGWGHPFLGGLSEEDALAQVEALSMHMEERLGARPEGGIIAEEAWDPELTRVLARAGLSWTLLDERLTDPGEHLVGVPGWYVTDRGGATLKLLPHVGLLRRLLQESPPTRLLRHLARRAKAKAGAVVVCDRIERLAGDRDLGSWVAPLFKGVAEQAHWLRPTCPSALMRRLPLAGRRYPPPWTPPELARWLIGPAEAARLHAYAREANRNTTLRRGPPFSRSTPWEATLARYDEANRLRSRTWLASRELHRLQEALDDEPAWTERAGVLRGHLERAQPELLTAQCSDVLWHGPTGGIYNGGLRHRVWEAIGRVEREVAEALEDAPRVRHVTGDHDRDSLDEVLVRTPHLSAMIDPEAGGALTELLAYDLPANLLNTLTRREEPLHEALHRFTASPALVNEDGELAPSPRAGLKELAGEADREESIAAILPAEERDRALWRRLETDPVDRACFQDHFLAEGVRIDQLRSGQYEELGDFFGADYKLETAELDSRGRLTALLTREGQVRQASGSGLVRILKRFTFGPELPALQARYEVVNRAHSPVQAIFGVTLNLNLDSETTRGEALVMGDGPPRQLTAAGVVEDLRAVEMIWPAREAALRVEWREPARVWHYPVECVCRDGHGLTSRFQGVCLTIGWDLRLWGEERRTFDLRLRVLPPKS